MPDAEGLDRMSRLLCMVLRPLLLSLASCVEPSARDRVRELCGEPPLIVGVSTFTTYITGHEYVCETPADERWRVAERRVALKWEECAIDAIDGQIWGQP